MEHAVNIIFLQLKLECNWNIKTESCNEGEMERVQKVKQKLNIKEYQKKKKKKKKTKWGLFHICQIRFIRRYDPFLWASFGFFDFRQGLDGDSASKRSSGKDWCKTEHDESIQFDRCYCRSLRSVTTI